MTSMTDSGIERLSGSSEPTGALPSFEPIATAAPLAAPMQHSVGYAILQRPRMRSGKERLAELERDPSFVNRLGIPEVGRM